MVNGWVMSAVDVSIDKEIIDKKIRDIYELGGDGGRPGGRGRDESDGKL